MGHHPMNRTQSTHNSENGFTLIEIIATVIVMGILAAFLMNFMGTAMTDSWRSLELVADEARAEGLMEIIIADYVEKINVNPADPAAALTAIKDDESTYESADDYGMPVTMGYIRFNNGVEEADTAGENRNLKVTIESSGYNLTTILTESRTDSNELPVIY
jgi:prepilin-type N-terminal cleavage/methylation domain-containing protein